MKARLILASVIVPLGLIIAAVPENTIKPFKLTAQQLLDEVNGGAQFISPDDVAHMLISRDPSLQLIDVRPADEFVQFSLPGSINIPLADFLDPQYSGYINQDVLLNVFYSNGSTKSNEAWMIARQLGYRNNYVLQGGLNYWADVILKPQTPAEGSPDDEIARYSFRNAAGMALGGTPTGVTAPPTKAVTKPPARGTAKKKRVQGGC